MATILVVDDNPIIQRMLSYTLRKDSHTVLTAANGLEALEHLAQSTIGLMIADLAMPEMDGLELLKHVRADRQLETLPVIMLTASGLDQDRLAAREEGVNDFLTKPASSRELIETVNRVLGQVCQS